MLSARNSEYEGTERDIRSFIESRPPLITNPFMRRNFKKGTNLDFSEDLEYEEPELVKVYLRLKPCRHSTNLYEVRSDRCLITSLDTTTAGHGRRTQHNVSKMYTFSHIFGQNSEQKQIFEQVVKDNLKKLPEGNSFTLLTYGASGSGKTFTLMGTVAAPGLVPRSLEYVFKVVDAAQRPLFKPDERGVDRLSKAEQEYELQWVKQLREISGPSRNKYRRMSVRLDSDLTISHMDLSDRRRHYVWVSFIEIYNEGIYDLLVPGDRKTASKLAIREDTSGNVYVKGATQVFVRTGVEAYDVMVAGKHNLQVAATGIHAESSRSHCIFTITMLTETENGMRSACVRLCDLAGCERAARTRNTGARMHESRAINSSLHVLERCLRMLRRKRVISTIVPYRESKLTRLLGAGLSGTRGEAVSMVVTVNPSPEYANETRHVLQLAAVAKDIQINNTISEYPSSLESSTQNTTIGYNSTEVMKLRSDNERLHFELIQAEARNKELLACMEEKQASDADVMREVVEEAKAITKQYYEEQIAALRKEIEEMEEDFETRLKEAPQPTNGGTPSKILQNQIAQLMTEFAILEEKLSAERLARARAEEEVQHLRACIEERDEKADEIAPHHEDVISLSDSDNSESEEDQLNESLEPTFKMADINRSRMIRQSLIADSIRCNSICENSLNTLKDHDETDDSNDSYNENTSNILTVKKASKVHTNISRGTYYVDRVSDDDNKTIDKDITTAVRPLSRTTYCVTTSEDIRQIDEEESLKDDTVKVTEDNILNVEANSDIHKTPKTLPDTFVKKLMASLNQTSDSNNSLIQFERLELETKTSDSNKNRITQEFSNINIKPLIKEKRNYFDVENIDKCTSALTAVVKAKDKKIYFDNLNVEKDQNQVDQNNVVQSPTVPIFKKSYFENTQSESQTQKDEDNNLVLQNDDYRSSSIVNEDVINTDFEPSAIKKLLEKAENVNSIKKFQNTTKTPFSIDMFEEVDSPLNVNKAKDPVVVLESNLKSLDKFSTSVKDDNACESANLVETKPNSVRIKKERMTQSLSCEKIISTAPIEFDKQTDEAIDNLKKETNVNEPLEMLTGIESLNCTKVNNTIEEFDNIYKDVTVPRATEFDLLVTQEIKDPTIEDNHPNSGENSENKELKYHLRNRTKFDEPKTERKRGKNKVLEGEILVENVSKCESKSRPVRKNLRLRRHNNCPEQVEVQNRLKNIVNLQTEFSDVTMDVPAPVKPLKDIPSPQKDGNEENSAVYGIQSCPAKSVTRSRRKLFTPRAEPLEESSGHTGDSNERLFVRRPSYHRPRARRKL